MSSACRSLAISAICSGRTQTSSTISAVPGARIRPTSPCMPSRTVQWTSIRSGSRSNTGSRIRVRAASTSAARASAASSSASSAPPNSTSSAAEDGSSSRQLSGVPRMLWLAMISAGATISSTARAPAATKSRTGSSAASTPAKCSHETVVRGGCGTVSKTASAMNPSVPSEPTSRRRKISTGVSASRKAQSR